MIKVNSLVVKVAGVLLAVVGLLALLFGFLIWNKQAMATGFIACIIAAVLLYYAWRMPPQAKENEATDAGAGFKQKV